MYRLRFIIAWCMLLFSKASAQDTIVLNGQPQWQKGMPILDNCFFYDDRNDAPLSFEKILQQQFAFYTDSLRQDKPSMRPLVIQWLRFSIHNSAVTDTIHLWLNPGGHYFMRLYNRNGLLAKSGIYEASVSGFKRASFALSIPPNSSETYWLRTEDRQGKFAPAWMSLETTASFLNNHLESVSNSRLLFLLLSLLTGCLFFITFFAAYHFFLYRDKTFLWYIAYTVSAAFTGLFWIDVRHQFGLFSSFFLDLIFSMFLFFVPVLYSLFIGKMLKLPQQFKKGWKIVKILLVMACIQMLIEFTTIHTGKFLFVDQYGYFVSMIPVTILNIVLLVLTAMSKEKVKWFMFTGLLSMLLLWCLPLIVLSNLRFAMDAVGVVFIFIPFYFLLGLTIEAICFSFALSYRSKLVLNERNNLQKQYAAQLQGELQKRTKELEAQNKVLEEQKLKQVQTAFEKKIAETEMTALRAQMNPHFIFNCLNSIKLYTLENDSQTASDYLSMFSQLIRLVLENSRSEKVTLEKEMETLQLYINLEAMRFKDKVKYQIHIAPDIDQQYIKLPPLLIQPYVENAIWHGLMHKKEGGNIVIDITQTTDYFLLVEIKDDGIGREQAAAYKSKSATKQKSFGLKMTSERLEMINQVYGIKADVQVEDLKDEMKNAKGTKVIIKIPV
ncbi:MAG TPA: histidine kinase [Ferruginibacter sp.]|nr:histidine kinase [Ferruginibacter sp.]HPH90671.1 histidine kinase [Ferruginibacter sp.]